MVGVNISHSYFHPAGAHITWVKIISQSHSVKCHTACTCRGSIRYSWLKNESDQNVSVFNITDS